MLVVSDTSPLRALQAIRQIALIERLYRRVLVPPAVAAELAVRAPSIGTFAVSDYPFVVVQSPADAKQVSLLCAELNRGEAEALALALEIRADAVLVDESPARRVAARLGLKAFGVLALLVEAKENNFVTAVAPLIDALEATINFRISPALRRRILADAGESQ